MLDSPSTSSLEVPAAYVQQMEFGNLYSYVDDDRYRML